MLCIVSDVRRGPKALEVRPEGRKDDLNGFLLMLLGIRRSVQDDKAIGQATVMIFSAEFDPLVKIKFVKKCVSLRFCMDLG